jgi:subtilisin family serine protease
VKRPVTVILELAGRPALGAGVSRSAQQDRASQLRTLQRPVVSAVRATGSTVTARYQYAYNGLRVRTTMGKLPELASIRGVVAVRPVRVYERTNVNGVPAVGGPAAWGDSGATGEGVRIAVIDTGIDYTHANFGGEGTVEAFDENDPDVVEPGSFPTRKVVGGVDLVGDAYDADALYDDDDTNDDLGIPVPDDDPLDCNGHGSHVAGSAAGAGVLADHSTFGGPYDGDTVGDAADWVIGPGVAPEAKLFAIKVFGCDGSTDVVVDALEWVAEYNAEQAVGIDVVNMSLGSPFGQATDADAVATNNLVGSGVVVVTSAGNESDVPYITGSPGVATRSISVAALDATPTLPMATVDLGATDVPGINQNAFPGLPVSGTLVVLEDDAGTADVNEFLGCTADDYPPEASGAIVAVKRGVCAFVEKG